jgi:hypothetical protein
MSMSVGGSSALSPNLQSLLQQGATGVTGPANTADPLSVLLSAMPDSSANPDPTNSPPTSSSTATSAAQQFSTASMDELIKMQGALTGGEISPSQPLTPTGTDDSTDATLSESSTDDGTSSDDPSIQSSANLLDQLTQMQSQLLPMVAPAFLAIA